MATRQRPPSLAWPLNSSTEVSSSPSSPGSPARRSPTSSSLLSPPSSRGSRRKKSLGKVRFQDDPSGPTSQTGSPSTASSLGLGALLRFAGLEVSHLVCCAAVNCDGRESGDSLDLKTEDLSLCDSQPVIAFHERTPVSMSRGGSPARSSAAAGGSPGDKVLPTAAAAAALGASKEEILRKSWAPGSVLEVFSASLGCWLVALVTDADTGSLTIQFRSLEGSPLRKTIARSDRLIAPFGQHCMQALPPGVRCLPASPTQGGQRRQIFVEVATSTEHASPEAAWRSYYEKLIKEWQRHGG